MSSAQLLERTRSTVPIEEPEPESSPGLDRFVVASGLLAAFVGAVMLAYTAVTTTPAVSLETSASSGQLAARLDYYEWLEHNHAAHDHDEEDGEIDGDVVLNAQAEAERFAMPASMMPGTPDEGYQRLQIELNLRNTGGSAAEVFPAIFWLEDGEGGRWQSLQGGTFRNTVLNNGHSLDTVLAFDVEDNKADADMELVWFWAGEETRFVVTGSDHH